MIVAFILHSGLKLRLFNAAENFSYADIFMLMARVWLRLFPNSSAPPSSLESDVTDYLNGTGRYESMTGWYQMKVQALREEELKQQAQFAEAQRSGQNTARPRTTTVSAQKRVISLLY